METTTEAASFPCPSCGAALRHKAGTMALLCNYCGHSEAIAPPQEVEQPVDSARAELDLEEALRNWEEGRPREERPAVRCRSCGAEVEVGAQARALPCPWCASPLHVEDQHDVSWIHPAHILPHGLDGKDASARMVRWIRGLWFAPTALVRLARLDTPVQSFLMPFFTFDAFGEADYHGARGTVHTRTVRGPGGRSRMVHDVRWTSVSGHVTRSFNDVLVPATASLPVSLLTRLEPWDLGQLKSYDPRWLAGHRADLASVPLRDAANSAHAAMLEGLRNDALRDIGGDRQRIDRLDARFTDRTFKLVLLPVFVAAFRWKDRPYRVLVNARTGEVVGERPWSATKIAAAVLLGLLGLFGLLEWGIPISGFHR